MVIILASAAASASMGSGIQGNSVVIFGQSLESFLVPFVNIVTFGIDIAAGLIIGISAIIGLISFIKILRKPTIEQTQEKETIRLRLARGMLLALDFEVGSDILKTVLVPSFTDLSILAVIVGIRIILSWSLSKEIDKHNIDLKSSGK
jgi:uncharacterized membrane protein